MVASQDRTPAGNCPLKWMLAISFNLMMGVFTMRYKLYHGGGLINALSGGMLGSQKEAKTPKPQDTSAKDAAAADDAARALRARERMRSGLGSTLNSGVSNGQFARCTIEVLVVRMNANWSDQQSSEVVNADACLHLWTAVLSQALVDHHTGRDTSWLGGRDFARVRELSAWNLPTFSGRQQTTPWLIVRLPSGRL